MKTSKSLIFILPVLALVLMSCRIGNVTINGDRVRGSGNTATEERQVRDVERVLLEDIGDLTIIQGDEEGLTVEADDNLLEYIETRMRGRELVIEIRDGIQIQSDNPPRYTLRVKSLDHISVSGSGNVKSEALDLGDLTLSVSGSGNMRFDNLRGDDLRVRASGSGNFDLAGTVERQEVSISGSGNYTAGDLESERADVSITGAGNVTLWANESLEIRISGFGNVNYYGTPEVSQSITGGGGIKSLGEKE